MESDNPAVILSGIKLYWSGTGTTLNGVTAAACDTTPSLCNFGGNASTSEDTNDFKLVITPSVAAGTSKITLTIKDSTDGDWNFDEPGENDTFYEFTVTVQSTGVIHNGWANIKSLGPKVDRNDNVIGNPKVCSFSESKCNGGFALSGNVSTRHPPGR